MNFLDKIQSIGEDTLSNLSTSLVTGSLEQLGLITIGNPPRSNLTSKQISSGKRGVMKNSQIQPRPENSNFLKDGIGFPLIGKISIPILVISVMAGIAFFIRFRR